MAHSNPEKARIEALREDFCSIFDKNKRAEAEELFKKLTKEYQSENRKYHNLEHIEKMLSFLRLYNHEIKDNIGLKLAVYFHDVIYNTKAKDDEEQSAQYAQSHLTQLGISGDTIAHIMALILATSKHEVIEDDTDSAIFLDADLAILGANKEDYDEYATKIRREYFWLSDEEYRIARKKVLQDFLNRPRIYFTEKAVKELELRARENIKREIASLS